MITVHHLNNSRSHRILWLLEELGLDYEIRPYQRDPETMLAPDSLMQVHPLGKSPVVIDQGNTLAESGAIIEYLVDRYGDGRLKPPSGTTQELRYTYWLHYAEGSAMPQIKRHLSFMEAELEQTGWFAGDEFTAADVQMSFPLEAAATRGGLDGSWPQLTDFLQRIHGRAAYHVALERGGPYELLS